MICKVADKEFKTKKDLTEYTKNLIKSKGLCAFDDSDSDFNFFVSLYNRKPNAKKDIKILKFTIENNPITFTGANHLSTVTKDGKFAFSWKDACTCTQTSELARLIEACRGCIFYQTNNCYTSCHFCALCNSPKIKGFEVDHKDLNFSEIFKTFMSDIRKDLKIPTQFLSTFPPSFLDFDNTFEKAFQEYHQKMATFQLLCLSCHRLKTNKK